MTQKTNLNEEDIDLEKSLQFSLSPVQPNPEFVCRLRGRLIEPPSIMIEPRKTAAAFVVVTLGLFVGVFFVWLIRAIFKNN
ncbi:MAG TPA: hypothetical protein VKF38_16770 [Anaerolineaceae bacterium]|nr:hypothetical protein [Anaerolineaceae bacterium]